MIGFFPTEPRPAATCSREEGSCNLPTPQATPGGNQAPRIRRSVHFARGVDRGLKILKNYFPEFCGLPCLECRATWM
jgi:hypothetical protein